MLSLSTPVHLSLYPIHSIAAPVQLLDRLLLTYVLLSHGRMKEDYVHQTLLLIYSRTTPSVSVLCELCKLMPAVMVKVLAEVVKS